MRTQLSGGGGDGAGMISSDVLQMYSRSRHGVMPKGANRSRMAFCVVIVRQAWKPRSVSVRNFMEMRMSASGRMNAKMSSGPPTLSRLQSMVLYRFCDSCGVSGFSTRYSGKSWARSNGWRQSTGTGAGQGMVCGMCIAP